MNQSLSINTRTDIRYFLAGVVLIIATVAATNKAEPIAAMLPLSLIFLIFLKKPELPLAVVFNGTLVYFYLIYKMGFSTNRILTASFFAVPACSFLLAEILMLIKGHKRIRISLIDVLFSILFFSIFISYLLFSTSNDMAFKKISYAPLLAIAPYFGARLMLSEIRIKELLRYSILVPAALMIPAFYELFYNPVITERPRFSMYIFEGSTNQDNPILFGNMYGILIVIVLVRLLELRRLRLWYFVPLGLSAYLILLSGSRGVIVSFTVSMMFYFFVISRIKLKTKLLVASTVLLLFVSGYKLLPEKLTDFYQYTVTTEAREEAGSSIQMRLSRWNRAISDISEHPVLGLGLGNSDNGSGRPHNIILEAAAELGVFGLSIFLLMCYTTTKKAMKFIRNEESSDSIVLMKIVFVLFVYSLTHAMFSGIITDQIRLYTTMGLIVCLDNLRLEKTKNEVITA